MFAVKLLRINAKFRLDEKVCGETFEKKKNQKSNFDQEK
jgi:hypothetical protein